MDSVHVVGAAGALRDLSAMRQELYDCVTARSDAVFELIDAVLCADGPVRSLPELSLVAEHRRGHGSVYAAALDRGRIDVERLRLVLAVGITCWLRAEAHTCPQRILCHTYDRAKNTYQT